MPERSTIDEEHRGQRDAASSAKRAVRATRVRSRTVVEIWEIEADLSSQGVKRAREKGWDVGSGDGEEKEKGERGYGEEGGLSDREEEKRGSAVMEKGRERERSDGEEEERGEPGDGEEVRGEEGAQ